MICNIQKSLNIYDHLSFFFSFYRPLFPFECLFKAKKQEPDWFPIAAPDRMLVLLDHAYPDIQFVGACSTNLLPGPALRILSI